MRLYLLSNCYVKIRHLNILFVLSEQTYTEYLNKNVHISFDLLLNKLYLITVYT